MWVFWIGTRLLEEVVHGGSVVYRWDKQRSCNTELMSSKLNEAGQDIFVF